MGDNKTDVMFFKDDVGKTYTEKKLIIHLL